MEGAMKQSGIKVELTFGALREFREILDHPHDAIAQSGKRRLTQLIRFSPRKWAAIQQQWRNSAFRSESRLPFDIQGKVLDDASGKARKVLITRFKLKGKAAQGAAPAGKK
jgi:hypothetical protein